MSYILDALRRAEAERERGSVPGLHAQAVGSAGAAAPVDGSARAPRWALPAIVALGLTVVLLGWRPWAADVPPAVVPPGATPSPVQKPEPTVAPATAPSPALVERLVLPLAIPARRPEAAAPVAVPAKKRPGSPASSAAAAPATAASAAAPAAKVATLAELPEDIRREVPPITIGGSIYSANPASRFVIVNGQLFHEGDTLAPGLVLEQIRLKSAVLSFRGYRYSVTF